MITKQIKTFSSYVIPSILAFALSGIYTIVDGFFVGRSLGDIGLAAITLGYPISALIGAIGTGIGLSGAIHFSISGAQGKKKEATRVFFCYNSAYASSQRLNDYPTFWIRPTYYATTWRTWRSTHAFQ